MNAYHHPPFHSALGAGFPPLNAPTPQAPHRHPRTGIKPSSTGTHLSAGSPSWTLLFGGSFGHETKSADSERAGSNRHCQWIPDVRPDFRHRASAERRPQAVLKRAEARLHFDMTRSAFPPTRAERVGFSFAGSGHPSLAAPILVDALSLLAGSRGEGGIRTHGDLSATPVFKTGAINHSTTSPGANHNLAQQWSLPRASWRSLKCRLAIGGRLAKTRRP